MDARELKDQASDHFRKGKFGKAAEAYLQLTKLEPKEGQHLIKLGDSYRRDGRKEEAIVAYRKAVDDYAKQGIVIKAIAACKLILEIDPNQKDAQEALATLCAKRYVKRDDVDASAPPAPPPKKAAAPGKRAPITEPIDLPDDDGDVGEIETLGGASPQKAEPPKPPPPRAVAPRVEPPKPPPPKMEASLDIDLDLNEPSMKPAAKAPPRPVVPPPPEPPPQTEVELDLGFDAPAPVPVPAAPSADRRRGGQTYDLGEMEGQLDAGDAVLEGVLEEAETIGEIEPEEELPPGISIVTAENTGEKALLNAAAAAAKKPPTPMAEILADSLLIEGDDGEGEEIELVSVTTGQPARPPPPPPRRETTLPPGRPIATGPAEDLVDDADFAAPSEAEQQQAAQAKEAADEERREMMRLANEAAFDLSTPPPADEEAAPEAAKPPPAPAVPSGDVAQKDVPLFSELPKEAFLDLLEQVQFRRVDEGEVIVREGDQGKSIYILASGQAKVMKALGTDAPIELATLEDGAFFGEMALLNGAPRVASVVASADSEVLELTEVILRDLTAKHPSVATSLKKFYRQRLLSNVMAISPLFRAFDKSDRKMLVEKFKLREAKPDEAIISEGEKPDGLYVIMHGTALVAKKDATQGRSVPLAVLKEGDVFGEMSLLSKKPASASVVAKRKTLVLRLPKNVFDELMFTHPAVLEVVSELTDQRTKVNEQILSGKVDAPREALAML